MEFVIKPQQYTIITGLTILWHTLSFTFSPEQTPKDTTGGNTRGNEGGGGGIDKKRQKIGQKNVQPKNEIRKLSGGNARKKCRTDRQKHRDRELIRHRKDEQTAKQGSSTSKYVTFRQTKRRNINESLRQTDRESTAGRQTNKKIKEADRQTT